MEEEYKIDERELVRQMQEDIIKKGNYVQARIVIEAGKKECTPCLELCNVGIQDVAFLMATLKKMIDNLENEYPLAALYTKFGKLESELIKYNKEEEEEEE